jgi:hypothetical protein
MKENNSISPAGSYSGRKARGKFRSALSLFLCGLLVSAFVVGCGLLPAEEDQLGTSPGDESNTPFSGGSHAPPAEKIEDVETILKDPAVGGTNDAPVVMAVQMSVDDLEDVFDIIAENTKYVALDLTQCAMKDDGVFGPLPDEGSAYITAIALPDTAKKIAKEAFGAESRSTSKFPNLTYVSGKNVIEVGDYAFSYCKNLERVDFPKATKIGEYAFLGCTSLETVNLPKVTEFGRSPFGYTGGTALTITLSGTPPTIRRIMGQKAMFVGVTVSKKVTLEVPHKPTYDDNVDWKNSFTGGNTNIKLKIKQK